MRGMAVLSAALLVLAAFPVYAYALTSPALPDVSAVSKRPERPGRQPERLIVPFRLVAEGWASPIRRPGKPEPASLECLGVVVRRSGQSLHERGEPITGVIRIRRLTVAVGGREVVFRSGRGYLGEKRIFMQASTRRFIPAWRAEGEPLYALIVLRGVRDGDKVELKGVLLVVMPGRGFMAWRLHLTGEFQFVETSISPR